MAFAPYPVLWVEDGGILVAANDAAGPWLQHGLLGIGKSLPADWIAAKGAGSGEFPLQIDNHHWAWRVVLHEKRGSLWFARDISREQLLARFPDRNPHPVMRVALTEPRVLLYANPASTSILEYFHMHPGDPISPGLGKVIENARQHGTAELSLPSAVYELLVIDVPEFQVLNIYGTDVTAARQVVAAQAELARVERVASLGRLAAGVAHELNTPLGVALTASSMMTESFTEMANKTRATSCSEIEQQAFLQKGLEATALITKSLARTGDLLRRFRGTMVDRSRDQIRPVQVRTYVESVFQEFVRRQPETPLQLQSGGSDPTVSLFVESLGQVVELLLSNVVQHAANRSLRVDLRVHETDHGLMVVLDDYGPGIPPSVLPRVFDPFFTTMRPQGCLGIGLHIAQTLVSEVLLGSLVVSSRPDGGTRASLRLPLSPASAR